MFTKTLKINDKNVKSTIDSLIEIGVNYDYTKIVTYNQDNQKNDYIDFVSKSTSRLTKKIIVSKDGYCIIEW